jgi:AraC-like DNA-binding protein
MIDIHRQRAADLLRYTAMPVADIAHRCGYADPFWLSS